MVISKFKTGPLIISYVLLLGIIRGGDLYGQDLLKHPPAGATVSEKIEFYLDYLGDPAYVRIMEHDGAEIPYYVAAERLGSIGRPAIPPLIETLNRTEELFERKMAFYALRLAVQHENVREIIGRTTPFNPPGTYNRAYPPAEDHEKLLESWNRWWNRYGESIESGTGTGNPDREE